MNYIKHSAFNFCKRNHIKGAVTLKSLTKAAHQNDYIVYSYSSSSNIMLLLGIYNNAQTAASVSVKATDGNTIIFIDDSLSKNKQLFALAHEIGHIVLDHNPVDDKALLSKQEREANKFAHYILTTDLFPYRKAVSSLAAIGTILILLITVLSLPDAVNQPASNSSTASNPVSSYANSPANATVCYYTKYGSVYHIYRECTYLDVAAEVYEAPVDNCPAHKLCSRCEKRTLENYK